MKIHEKMLAVIFIVFIIGALTIISITNQQKKTYHSKAAEISPFLEKVASATPSIILSPQELSQAFNSESPQGAPVILPDQPSSRLYDTNTPPSLHFTGERNHIRFYHPTYLSRIKNDPALMRGEYLLAGENDYWFEIYREFKNDDERRRYIIPMKNIALPKIYYSTATRKNSFRWSASRLLSVQESLFALDEISRWFDDFTYRRDKMLRGDFVDDDENIYDNVHLKGVLKNLPNASTKALVEYSLVSLDELINQARERMQREYNRLQQ